MSYVYLLEATGTDWLLGEGKRIVRNTVVFARREAAESRVEKFKQVCIDGRRLMEPITVDIVEMEVIE